jgi:uncharacterized membrane protein
MEAVHRDSESKLRSAAKALSYRLVGTLTTMGLTFTFTGDAATALAVGSVEPALKLVTYYLHERAWQHVPAGSLRRLLALCALPLRQIGRLRPALKSPGTASPAESCYDARG